MNVNWKGIKSVFARTLQVDALSLNAEGKEVLTEDQREKLKKQFGTEVVAIFEGHISKAVGEESTEQDMATFLDAVGRAGVENRAELVKELAAAQAERKTLKEQLEIIKAEKEKLEHDPEGKPTPVGAKGKAGARTFAIDSKASFNMIASSALATGNMPTFSASTIDVTDLKRELGTYSSQGNSLDLLQDIYRDFTSAKHMTPKRAIESYKAVKADYTSVVQQFSAKWTPAGNSKFTALKITNFRHKVNFAIVPADVANSWLLSLYNEKMTPDQMPITRYIVQNTLLPSILQDIEMKMIGKGKYKEKTDPNTAGVPEESMDGIETILVEAAKTGTSGINFYPDAKDLTKSTDAEVLAYIDDFANKISQKYQALKMNIFCAGDVYKKYKRAYKTKWGEGSGTENPDFGKDRVDFTNFSLQVLDCMYGSPIIFCTPKLNFVMLQNLNAPQVITDVQKVDYEVRYYGEFWLGVGFAIGEMVFASVPAGYNPQAVITSDGSTDFWKNTNAVTPPKQQGA